MTHNLYQQLLTRCRAISCTAGVFAEALATRWLSTLTPADVQMYDHVCDVAHHVIAECYSRHTIIPGYTTLDDLHWHDRQRCTDLGFTQAFKPSFLICAGPLYANVTMPPITSSGPVICCIAMWAFNIFASILTINNWPMCCYPANGPRPLVCAN